MLLAGIQALRALAGRWLESAFPIPEDAPVTRAHGPNLSLSNSCFIIIPSINDTNAFVDQSCVRLAPLRSDLSQAAVDGQLDARHESGVGRGQEQSRPGDLLRLTEAAQRHHRGARLLHLLRHLGHGRGVDGPGSDDIDADLPGKPPGSPSPPAVSAA